MLPICGADAAALQAAFQARICKAPFPNKLEKGQENKAMSLSERNKRRFCAVCLMFPKGLQNVDGSELHAGNNDVQ